MINDLYNSLIRDRLILGMVLRESELTLGKFLQICRAAELSNEKTVFDKLSPRMYTQCWNRRWVVRLSGSVRTVVNPMLLTRINVQHMAQNATNAIKRIISQVCARHHCLKPENKDRNGKGSVHTVDAEENMQDSFADVIKSSESSEYWFVDLKLGFKCNKNWDHLGGSQVKGWWCTQSIGIIQSASQRSYMNIATDCITWVSCCW